VSSNELVALATLAVACVFAAGFLFRSWRRRRTRPPLIGAVVVLVVGTGAIVLALLGVPYRNAVGFAFILAMGAVLVSARADRRLP
jgi:peptidoglycan/LPS O-acetylase OafA/YrhL